MIIFQLACQVVFHTDYLEFSPPVTTYGAMWPTLLAGASAGAALVAHALTKTASPNTYTPASVRSGKNNQTVHNQRVVQP